MHEKAPLSLRDNIKMGISLRKFSILQGSLSPQASLNPLLPIGVAFSKRRSSRFCHDHMASTFPPVGIFSVPFQDYHLPRIACMKIYTPIWKQIWHNREFQKAGGVDAMSRL
jgi:hypothetical protein